MSTAVTAGWLAMAAGLGLAGFLPPGGGLLGLAIGLLALPIWIVGACMVGVPAWIALHHAGVTSRRAAVVSGALIVGIAHPTTWVAVLGGFSPINDAIVGLIALSAIGAVSGGVAALTLHKSFYPKG